jgi:hypothetical protein
MSENTGQILSLDDLEEKAAALEKGKKREPENPGKTEGMTENPGENTQNTPEENESKENTYSIIDLGSDVIKE